ncbi:hypothetical protein LY90DRAFT_503206 [Neocallimastix californiae]|uniref:Uncharacterized protein n=1 Tax=Neocallimastix californiae TaxID=1754190 RepID=A0A1Y2EP94_9FUNG|nr:hypothetical protein LY90DRAFT_503206 [Neocallimastix californiae]|eukprot:ORY73347.1 hypothetical protein LY90DRAFT_503206 [Neocallimastix californiae]
MKSFINIFLFMSIIAFLVNSINARSLFYNLSISKPKNSGSSDNYYVIFINNTLLKSESLKEKHQENKYIFSSLMNEIHNLIIDNKNTFEDINKFNTIKEKKPNSNKKEIEKKYLMKEGDSNIVFPISTLKDEIVLRVYLSKKLVDNIKSLDYVIDCIPYLDYNNKF